MASYPGGRVGIGPVVLSGQLSSRSPEPPAPSSGGQGGGGSTGTPSTAGIAGTYTGSYQGLSYYGAAVQRSEAMAEDLVFTRVETPGGAQRMATLVLRSIAYWFATIDSS